MADQHDAPSNRGRIAPPPFIGPPRPGALTPKPRADRPTLPPFSPPFVRRPSPAVPEIRAEQEAPARGPSTGRAHQSSETHAPAWLEAIPNESASVTAAGAEGRLDWVNPDEPAVVAPPQAATGIEWLDSPATGPAAPTATSTPSQEDLDDAFGWDPAEERGGALGAPPAAATLDALKELEPWALPGAAPSVGSPEDVAAALDRVAARVRSGELFVPGAPTAAADEAVLAAVLAALLQRAPG
jgi:hypothetical protein